MQKSARIKLIVFFLLIGTFFAVRQWTPAGEAMTVENLRLLIEPLGLWGILIFVGVFSLGILFQIPGILFYSASFMIFGTALGGLIAYVGSVVAVIISFYFARQMGGSALTAIKSPRLQRMLLRLEEQPILIVGMLRAIMWVAPPLNYALAFSTVPYKKHIIGSTIGLVVPATAMALTSCLF